MAVIRFEKVRLTYPIRNPKGISLKELLLGRGRRGQRQLLQEIHALEDVTFQIDEGERVGVIGFNGAGKSTLLRTVAGVYPVTWGRREVLGRICSLFDIHLGFDLEATGLENIRHRLYLQGEMPHAIKDRTDSIVDFCELQDFIHLPLCCYSTGMLMRLAFAIATSSDPEILLIDEVFAAGDLAFQRKADERMCEFMNRAKIVVMVGHNLDYFATSCSRLLWLDRGRICLDGSSHQVIEAYRAAVDVKRRAA